MKIGNKVSAQVNEVALNAFQQRVREKVSCAETKYSTEQSPNDERRNARTSSLPAEYRTVFIKLI